MTENHEPETGVPKPGHLGYLLTAYLFESLSAAGKAEVEAHLPGCAECRAELDALRQTLGLAEQALDPGGKKYVFEERRRLRVLEAAYHASQNPRAGALKPWRFSYVAMATVAGAALFMVAVNSGLFAGFGKGVKSQNALVKSGAKTKYETRLPAGTAAAGDSLLRMQKNQSTAAGAAKGYAEALEMDLSETAQFDTHESRFKNKGDYDAKVHYQVPVKPPPEPSPAAPPTQHVTELQPSKGDKVNVNAGDGLGRQLDNLAKNIGPPPGGGQPATPKTAEKPATAGVPAAGLTLKPDESAQVKNELRLSGAASKGEQDGTLGAPVPDPAKAKLGNDKDDGYALGGKTGAGDVNGGGRKLRIVRQKEEDPKAAEALAKSSNRGLFPSGGATGVTPPLAPDKPPESFVPPKFGRQYEAYKAPLAAESPAPGQPAARVVESQRSGVEPLRTADSGLEKKENELEFTRSIDGEFSLQERTAKAGDLALVDKSFGDAEAKRGEEKKITVQLQASDGQAKQKPVELQIYDVSDLTTQVVPFPGPRIDIGTTAGAGGAGAMGDPFSVPEPATITPQKLEALIKEKLPPATWNPAPPPEEPPLAQLERAPLPFAVQPFTWANTGKREGQTATDPAKPDVLANKTLPQAFDGQIVLDKGGADQGAFAYQPGHTANDSVTALAADQIHNWTPHLNRSADDAKKPTRAFGGLGFGAEKSPLAAKESGVTAHWQDVDESLTLRQGDLPVEGKFLPGPGHAGTDFAMSLDFGWRDERRSIVDEDGNVVLVPREIRDKAQLGDKFETLNTDRPDTKSAFGMSNLNANAADHWGINFTDTEPKTADLYRGTAGSDQFVDGLFHSLKGSESEAGGGGMGGADLEDLIGVGGAVSPGRGGGWERAGRRGKQKEKNKEKEETPAEYKEVGEKYVVTPEHVVERTVKVEVSPGVFKDEVQKEVVPAVYGVRAVKRANNVAPEFDAAATLGGQDARATVPPVSIHALESALRGYRHLRAENKLLSFRDFLRRPTPVPPPLLTDEGLDEDAYIERHGTRPFVDCARDNLSTFGLDVDTASYTLARARLREGQLPARESVRVEEFLNYFKQPYTVAGEDAFGVFAEGAPSPFAVGPASVPAGRDAGPTITSAGGAQSTDILKIGIKSRDPRADERKPAMLTFIVDTSGSMARARTAGGTPAAQTRLDLVRGALKALLAQLQDNDAVSIVAFSDQAEVALPRTQARQKQRILDAIDALYAHGASNVEGGLQMGLRMADETYSAEAVNRVILCSDGVANVGAKGPDEILKLVKVFAGRGIDLYTVGFGMGQYNDGMMAKLADNGNGSCHFVDTPAEAERIFRERLPPHLNVLARDAKAQVEFNPEVVARYRLLGYEKRKIADKDFRNDKIDAGEVAHSTLLNVFYEIQRKPNAHGPLGKVFLRWKDAGHAHQPVVERNYPLSEGILAADSRGASPELRFLACVARFAELLRESPWARDGSYAAVLQQLHQLPPEFQARPEWQEVQELVSRAQQLTVQKWLKDF